MYFLFFCPIKVNKETHLIKNQENFKLKLNIRAVRHKYSGKAGYVYFRIDVLFRRRYSQ